MRCFPWVIYRIYIENPTTTERVWRCTKIVICLTLRNTIDSLWKFTLISMTLTKMREIFLNSNTCISREMIFHPGLLFTPYSMKNMAGHSGPLKLASTPLPQNFFPQDRNNYYSKFLWFLEIHFFKFDCFLNSLHSK